MPRITFRIGRFSAVFWKYDRLVVESFNDFFFLWRWGPKCLGFRVKENVFIATLTPPE